MVKKRLMSRGRAALQVILALLLAAPMAAHSEPAARSSLVRPMPRPGSREAFNTRSSIRTKGGAFVKSASGLYVPDRRITLATHQDLKARARWRGIRSAVFRHLKANGAQLAPKPYQRLLTKIRRRANRVLRKEGQSLGSWKMMVLEGGMADRVNAAAWTGGVITIYRPLVDLCFQIASVTVNTGSPVQLDKELWKVSRWRQDKSRSAAPESLKVSPKKKALRDKLAESILSRVVLHEMGHAASGHVELKDKQLIIPGQHSPRDLAKSQAMEREADHFAALLGVKGAVRVPGVMPLFSYYNFISRPNFDERGKYAIADWRTHPLNKDRYNAQRKVLEGVKRTRGLPLPLEQRLITPDGRRFATPHKAPAAAPRPAPQQIKQPLLKAAALPLL